MKAKNEECKTLCANFQEVRDERDAYEATYWALYRDWVAYRKINETEIERVREQRNRLLLDYNEVQDRLKESVERESILQAQCLSYMKDIRKLNSLMIFSKIKGE